MNTTVEEIRSALLPYVADTGGLAGFPEDLYELLENPTVEAKDLAEKLEGMLVLYGLRRISLDHLKEEIRTLVRATVREREPAKIGNVRSMAR